MDMGLGNLQASPPETDLLVLNDTNRKYLRKRKSDTASSDPLRTPSSDFPRTPSSDPLKTLTSDTSLSDVSRQPKTGSPLFFPCKRMKTNATSRPSSQMSTPEPPNLFVRPERLALVDQQIAPAEGSGGIKSKGVFMKPKREDLLDGTTAGYQTLPFRPRTGPGSRVQLPEEWFESPLINLLVGPNGTISSIHRELASNRSEKLRKRLSESNIEIVLENVNPKVFKHWKEWAYGNENLDGCDIELLYQLYFLATDLKSHELQTLVQDQIRAEYHKADKWPNQARVMHVYRNTTIGSPLRRFMVKSVYHRLMVRREDVQTYFGSSGLENRFIRDYVEFVQEVQYPNGSNDPRLDDGGNLRIQDVKGSTNW